MILPEGLKELRHFATQGILGRKPMQIMQEASEYMMRMSELLEGSQDEKIREFLDEYKKWGMLRR